MKKFTLLLALLLGFSAFLEAQVNPNTAPRRARNPGGFWMHPNYHRVPTLSVGFEFAFPQNEFSQNFEGMPIGIGGQFLTNAGRRSPFEFGMGFSWLSRGSAREDVFILEGQDINGQNIFSRGSMSVNSNIYTYNGIMRFKPLLGMVQPYIDGLVGVRNFSTSTVVRPEDATAETMRERQTRDFALTYGYAAGLKVRVTPALMVEGRFSNLFGTQVSYVDRTSLEIDPDGNISYEKISSRTDMFIVHLGVCFEF